MAPKASLDPEMLRLLVRAELLEERRRRLDIALRVAAMVVAVVTLLANLIFRQP